MAVVAMTLLAAPITLVMGQNPIPIAPTADSSPNAPVQPGMGFFNFKTYNGRYNEIWHRAVPVLDTEAAPMIDRPTQIVAIDFMAMPLKSNAQLGTTSNANSPTVPDIAQCCSAVDLSYKLLDSSGVLRDTRRGSMDPLGPASFRTFVDAGQGYNITGVRYAFTYYRTDGSTDDTAWIDWMAPTSGNLGPNAPNFSPLDLLAETQVNLPTVTPPVAQNVTNVIQRFNLTIPGIADIPGTPNIGVNLPENNPPLSGLPLPTGQPSTLSPAQISAEANPVTQDVVSIAITSNNPDTLWCEVTVRAATDVAPAITNMTDTTLDNRYGPPLKFLTAKSPNTNKHLLPSLSFQSAPDSKLVLYYQPVCTTNGVDFVSGPIYRYNPSEVSSTALDALPAVLGPISTGPTPNFTLSGSNATTTITDLYAVADNIVARIVPTPTTLGITTASGDNPTVNSLTLELPATNSSLRGFDILLWNTSPGSASVINPNITVNISEPVQSATLHYTINNGPQFNVQMQKTGGVMQVQNIRLKSKDVLRFWFTYLPSDSNTQVTSPQYSFTVPELADLPVAPGGGTTPSGVPAQPAAAMPSQACTDCIASCPARILDGTFTPTPNSPRSPMAECFSQCCPNEEEERVLALMNSVVLLNPPLIPLAQPTTAGTVNTFKTLAAKFEKFARFTFKTFKANGKISNKRPVTPLRLFAAAFNNRNPDLKKRSLSQFQVPPTNTNTAVPPGPPIPSIVNGLDALAGFGNFTFDPAVLQQPPGIPTPPGVPTIVPPSQGSALEALINAGVVDQSGLILPPNNDPNIPGLPQFPDPNAPGIPGLPNDPSNPPLPPLPPAPPGAPEVPQPPGAPEIPQPPGAPTSPTTPTTPRLPRLPRLLRLLRLLRPQMVSPLPLSLQLRPQSVSLCPCLSFLTSRRSRQLSISPSQTPLVPRLVRSQPSQRLSRDHSELQLFHHQRTSLQILLALLSRSLARLTSSSVSTQVATPHAWLSLRGSWRTLALHSRIPPLHRTCKD